LRNIPAFVFIMTYYLLKMQQIQVCLNFDTNKNSRKFIVAIPVRNP